MTRQARLRTRVGGALALFLPVLFLALPAAGDAGSFALAAALAAALASALVVRAGRLRPEPTTTPVQQRAVSIRERARSAGFLRLRDPDAPGRTRPRAPSAGSAAA
ncbi:DUF6412 domain-containing protein [Amycolatopsis cihanbeyliensis]|uniref:Uncharacterized protein n=1 Tax=Amycolatopsis cihanbeyliensis TaxID=1128664 RepID=A0A542DKY0_AMYCI|nr:DUF6412 domain-containing protein [Amycolatopsis cihanbeyliensis]TQJ03684.1 hypothetical protein FB471_3448 [Amycolatopsis cihanbeyliensis]